MTGKPTVNRKGKARLAPTIASIPLILLIGAIGVQTITSCTDGGSSPNGPIYSEPSNPTPSSSSNIVMGKCPDYFYNKVADAKIYNLENCTNIYEKTISCTGPSIPTEMYSTSDTWAGLLCAGLPKKEGDPLGYAMRGNPTYDCGHIADYGRNVAIIADDCATK